MRILRLDLGSIAGTIDFHPFVSVSHGLDAEQRDAIVEAFRGLVRGTTSDISGLVERNGELLELGLDNTSALGPFTTEDIVVSVDSRQQHAGDQEAALLRVEFDSALLRAECDAVHVEQIRADLDSTALALVRRLRLILAGASPLTARELGRQASAAAIGEAVSVAQALEPVLFEARPEVAGLVGRWQEYCEAEVASVTHMARLQQKIDDASAGLSRSNEALAEAERKAVPVVLSPEDDDRLSDLAAISFDRRGRRAKRRSDEEEVEYEALLAKVNQPTHAAYAMYRMAPHANPEGLAAVARATQSVERAEHNLGLVQESSQADPVAVELAAQLDLVKDEARLHLGPMLPADLGSALLALRHEAPNQDWLDAMSVVRAALVSAGAEVEEGTGDSDLVAWAGTWLEQSEHACQAERQKVNHDQVRLELQRAERALERHSLAMSRLDRVETQSTESAIEVKHLRLRISELQGCGALSSLDLVARIEPLADTIRAEAGDSVPLVLVGDFELVPDDDIAVLLDRLELLTENIQLVLLTERAEVLVWADRAGLRRAIRSTVLGLRM